MYLSRYDHRHHDRIKYILWLLAAVGLAAIIFIACEKPQAPPPAKTAEPTIDSHGLHAVRSADLRAIMHKLKSLKLDQVADEIEITGELNRDICELATIAESLAADAQLIPMLLHDQAMTPEAQRVMATMSARLRYEADALAEAANHSDIDRVRVELDAMMSTCTACHREFRAPGLATAGVSNRTLALAIDRRP